MPVIEIERLRKAYGPVVAVDDVSLTVERGEIFGVLGPNGAGKTTLVECVTGLRTADAGTVQVLGLDPRSDRERVRERVGIQLQSSALPAKIKVHEALALYASFHAQSADVPELVDALDLGEILGRYFGRLSGGQRQRLSIALALIGEPEVAVLDELTTGLDPQARRETWQFIERVRARGVTIVLVTHFMDEAERLCDRVAMIDDGQLVAAGSPAELAASVGGGTRMRLRPSGPIDDCVLTQLPAVHGLERHGEEIMVNGTDDVVTDVVLALDALGLRARNVRVEVANLEDAFLALTGHRIRQDVEESDAR
ncbi:MAG: ABC transporter ATP-binding protein [Actinomycetota bacterium]